jgi:hypothetical protein
VSRAAADPARGADPTLVPHPEPTAGPPPLAADPSLAPYEAILANVERQLELAGRGEFDGVTELCGQWDALTRGLPAAAPPAARSLLERAALVHERTRVELLRMREALVRDLGSVTRSRRAARGYAGPAGGPRRIDHSA